jgi:hypothetical protein
VNSNVRQHHRVAAETPSEIANAFATSLQPSVCGSLVAGKCVSVSFAAAVRTACASLSPQTQRFAGPWAQARTAAVSQFVDPPPPERPCLRSSLCSGGGKYRWEEPWHPRGNCCPRTSFQACCLTLRCTRRSTAGFAVCCPRVNSNVSPRGRKEPHVSSVCHRIARCLLASATLSAAAAIAAPSSSPAEPPASAQTPKKRALPAAKLKDTPARWDRLDPGAIERASKSRAPKTPSFPAERP